MILIDKKPETNGVNMIKITIRGRIPSKKNNRNIGRRGKKIFNTPSDKYKQWHEVAELEVLSQYTNFQGVKKIFMVELKFWMPDNLQKDLTNAAESIMDLLVDCRVIEDDRWQIIPCILLSCRGIDRENPRCEIEITEAT